MAKGIRSKQKRANRSRLREVLVKPLLAKRQAVIATEGARSALQRAGGTISALKSVLHSAKGGKAEENTAAVEEIVEPSANQARARDRVAFLKQKLKGSKPRANGSKDQVWF
jgi:hypothetical protein